MNGDQLSIENEARDYMTKAIRYQTERAPTA